MSLEPTTFDDEPSARESPYLTRAIRRRDRQDVARHLAERHEGVVHRATLRAHGIGRHDVRNEVFGGRWAMAGRHTVVVGGRPVPAGRARWWWAVWESGSGARLDGVSALLAQGMDGFVEPTVHVTVPRAATAYRLPGVTLHRRREPDPGFAAGIPRSCPEWAMIRAAQWARLSATLESEADPTLENEATG
ncbi:MAG: hypothetical protein ACOYBY_14080, partial [Dermatophilaceae bacterium]